MNESTNYNVVISDRAKAMLTTHIQFMAKVSKDAARDKKSQIINALCSLSSMPERFPYLEEQYIPYNKYHKMFVEKWYLIIYQVQGTTVYVDYIIDCRKDYTWLLR